MLISKYKIQSKQLQERNAPGNNVSSSSLICVEVSQDFTQRCKLIRSLSVSRFCIYLTSMSVLQSQGTHFLVDQYIIIIITL